MKKWNAPLALVCLWMAGPCLGQDADNRLILKQDGPHIEITTVDKASSSAGIPAIPSATPAAIPADLTVTQLVSRYIESFHPADKEVLLDKIGTTEPRTGEDLRLLLNLYDRNEPGSRARAEASLRLLSPLRQEFGPFFLVLLKDEDPDLQIFGLLGSLQLRYAQALPLIQAMASKHFRYRDPALSMPLREANEWRLHFMALQTLAMWEGPKALALLEDRSKEAPIVASVIATLYWEQALERIISWSESRNRLDNERASAAWRAVVPTQNLRATTPILRRIVLDRGKKEETRHFAAVKLGIAAADEDVRQLLDDYDRAKDQDTRLILATALFASRDQRVIPLLETFAKSDPSPQNRAGALFQLRDLLPRPKYVELLQWTAAHEPDEQNRSDATRQLSESNP